MSFRLNVLPANQQAIWQQFAAIPDSFVLYGGTALALRLAHRQSLDFDFFSSQPFVADRLQAGFPFVAEVIQKEENTLSIRTPNGVKMSFFSGLTFGRVKAPDLLAGVRVASLDDLFATKLNTIYQRCEAKDYLDVDAILRAGLSLAYGLGCARAIYGQSFNVMLPLKGLAYFEDGDLPLLPADLKHRLTIAVASVHAIPEVRCLPGRLADLK